MARLEVLLRELRPPPLTYLPLCRSSDVFCPVVRLPRGETHVFVTRERASVLLCAEVVRDSRGRKLSQLFEAVRRDEATKVFEGEQADVCAGSSVEGVSSFFFQRV